MQSLVLALVASAALASPTGDLQALERLITAVHPAPYRYTPAEEVHTAFAEERARLDGHDEVGELEVGRAVQRLVALLGDAHVFVGLPMMQQGSTASVSLLPVLLRRVDGRVLLDASTFEVPPGTELLAIDDAPVAAVYDDLISLVPADGGDPDAALRSLEYHFPRYYAFQHGFSDAYTLRLRLPDGSEATHRVQGADRAMMGALGAGRHVPAWWGAPTDDRLPALSRVDGVAVLRVPSFGIPDFEGFQARVDALFEEVSPDELLVIDLRGNEGGFRPNAFAILAHILTEPWVEWRGMRVAVRKVPKRLQGMLTWPFGPGLERLGPGFRRGQAGWAAEGDPLAHLARPAARTHRGEVALLVDGRTGSAANGLALVAKQERPDVRLVGEPLGGACDRHVGELPVVWTGPVTGVTVMFSLIDIAHAEVAGCEPGRGLPPDVRVTPTVEDFMEAADPWMRAATGRAGPDEAP